DQVLVPSGLVFWADGGTLVVASAKEPHLWAFRVHKDGTAASTAPKPTTTGLPRAQGRHPGRRRALLPGADATAHPGGAQAPEQPAGAAPGPRRPPLRRHAAGRAGLRPDGPPVRGDRAALPGQADHLGGLQRRRHGPALLRVRRSAVRAADEGEG